MLTIGATKVQMCRCADVQIAELQRKRGAEVLRCCTSAGVGAGLGEEVKRGRGAEVQQTRCSKRGAEVQRCRGAKVDVGVGAEKQRCRCADVEVQV